MIKLFLLVLIALLCVIVAWWLHTFVSKSAPVVWSVIALLIGVVIGKVLW